LAQALRDPNANVRLAALRALQTFGSDGHAAVEAVAATLKDKVPSVRRAAAEVLGQLAALVEPKLTENAVTALTAALRDHDPHVQRQAGVALGAIGGRAAPAAEALASEARSRRADAGRHEAALALGQLGAPALPHLRENLKHNDPIVRAEAV